jgi:hypothetical protein
MLPVGQGQTLSVTFTPNDSTDFTTVTATATINVTQATPLLTVIDRGGPFNGQPYPASATAAGVGGAAVRGSFTFAYKDSQQQLSGPPSAVGTYAVVATFTSADSNYVNVTSLPVAFSITPIPSGATAADVPTFAWLPVAGAKHYALKITEGKTVVLDLTNIVAATDTLTAAQALTPGQTYTWSVTPLNAAGKVIAASQSASFSIAALTAPTGLGFTSASDTFSWQAVTDAAHYALQVVDSASGKPVINIKGVTGTEDHLTSKQAATLLSGHTYTLFVTAVSSNGKASVKSSGARFTI